MIDVGESCKFRWNSDIEAFAVKQRADGRTYREISEAIGTTATSVKHKVRRIQQSTNHDRYKHTNEKTEQAKHAMSVLKNRNRIEVLETHAGFGGMTELYNSYGNVLSIEIDQSRIDHINSQGFEGVTTLKADSELELFNLVYNRMHFDIVDVDPYGFPSRYFPHVFNLINDGILFLTFPVMGVAQINKLMVEHYRIFWGISLSDIDCYIEKIKQKLVDMAIMQKRSISFLDVMRVGKVYRLAIRVEAASMCDIVGLEVNRGQKCR